MKLHRSSAPAPTAGTPTPRNSAPRERRATAAMLALLLVLLAVYAALAWLSSGSEIRWLIDVIDNVTVLNGDDAYRYFLARAAWQDLSLYAYNYVLPVALMLDGALATLLDDSLPFMRIAHAAVSLAALWLTYRAGRELAIAPGLMLLACALAGLLPLYALVSLSFYGEVWTGFFLCLTFYAFLHQRWTLVALAASVLPLTRPEGIFFFAPLWLYLAMRGQRRAAVLMLLPGVIYVLFLLLYLGDLTVYSYWRVELRKIYSKLVLIPDPWAMAKTYSLLWLLPAALGFCYRPLHRLWPIYAGALLWLLILIVTVRLNIAFYEPRYTYTLIPLTALAWAAAVQGFIAQGAWLLPSLKARRLTVYGLGLCVALSHVTQISPLVYMKRQEGLGWVARQLWQGQWSAIFPYHNKARLVAMGNAADRIVTLLERDRRIDQLMMFDIPLYYALDPKKVPSHVLVGYPVVSQLVADMLLKGQVFTQHQGGRMFSYFRFNKPDLGRSQQLALYVEPLGGVSYPYLWVEGPHEIYLFAYRHSWTPEVDLSRAPMIYPDMVVEEYYRSFR